MGGPGHDEAYLKGHPAPEKLFALAQVINKGHYDDDVVQNAIWVLSDGHDINSTGALDGSATDTLRNHLSALSGQPAPRYLVRYAPDGVRASSNRPETISRTISMDFANASNLMVLVKRDDGRIMEILHDQLPIGPGGFDLPLSVHVLTWPKGRYAFYVYTTETNSVRRLPFVL